VLNHSSYSFQIPPRDDAGFRALGDMRRRGLNEVANAVAQSADHVRGFFRALRSELAFYVGCLNLAERLTAKEEPICIPEVVGGSEPVFAVTGLYDMALSLHLEARTVGNDVTANGKRLVFVTGANQGGKSTFLRSVGQAKLMMQAGMFVPAVSFRARTASGVFTHYKREEDASMERGKLAEELARMRDIADQIRPDALLLCNESFASTNEREGSEIGRQVARAMTECGVDVFYVTHLYDLAHSFETETGGEVLFLRAERLPDGRRSFKLRPAAPLDTSFGADLYREILGVSESETEPVEAR
jgi:DNA mismatch repair ATPase MutS